MIDPKWLVDNAVVKALASGIQRLGQLGRRRVRKVDPQTQQNLRTGSAAEPNNPGLFSRSTGLAANGTMPSVTLFTQPQFKNLQAVISTAQKLRQESDALLAECPVQAGDIQQNIGQLKTKRQEFHKCLARLNQEIDEIEPQYSRAPEFSAACKAKEQLTQAIRDNFARIQTLKSRLDDCPASPFNLVSAKLDHYRAAIDAVTNSGSTAALLAKKQALVTALLYETEALEKELNTASRSNRVSKAEILNLKQLPQQLVKRLNQHGIPATLGTHKHIQAEQANKAPWNLSTRPVQFQYAGGYHRFTEISVPASKIRLPQSVLPEPEKGVSLNHGPFRTNYEHEGVAAHSTTEVNHATNLNVTSLKNDEDKEIFSAVRHGVLSPYGHPPGSPERINGALHRAEETALAALQLHPEKLKDALEGKPVELILTSNSLLTPDGFRHRFGKDEGDEQAMLQDQVEALGTLAERGTLPIQLPSGDIREVAIKLNIVPMNFGMNKFSQGKTAAATGGWGMSDRLNRAGLETLIGLDVGENRESLAGAYLQKLRENDPSDPEIPLIEEVISQIRELYHQNRHHATKGGAAKLAARVMVLTHMIGGTPLVNCKSGKDRTALAMTDAEWLMTRMRLTGKVPAPGQVSPADRRLFLELALQGHHLQIQQLNSGAPGFKLDPMILASYLDNPETVTYLRGLGDAVLA